MSQYQRMISYLYRYEEGVKGKNTGYVRIELRGQLCRLTLQLQDRLSALPEVWLFRQTADGVEKLLAGSLQLGGSGSRCRIETDAENLFQTGYSFSQMDGLIVYLQDSLFYGTTWNDVTLRLGAVKNIGMQQEAGRNHTGTDVGETEEQSVSASQERIEQAASDVREAADEEEISLEIAEEVTEDVETWTPEEGRTAAPQGMTGEGSTAAPQGMTGEGRTAAPQGMTGEADDKETAAGEASRQEEAKDREDAHGKLAACDCDRCRYCPQQSGQRDVGSHIMSLFPKMYPFELDSMGECVRLDLKDIGCLPVKCWSLAGNPFLLQGYYCYRHIIFTQRKQGDYCVGVPGIYNKENREWAKTCGMNQFQALSDVADLQGAFGYWLYSLKL